MRNIGDVIKRARMDCGMTQEQLGEKLFVTKQAVSKWETGKAYPDISILEKISKELKIDIADLLTSNLDSTVRKRKTVKLLLIIVPILLVIITSGIIVSYAIKEKQKWIPLVQGSSVYQMPFEELKTEFEYYIYDNFKDFKKSDSAKYHFINAKASKDERYTRKFFKENNLMLVKFNNAKGIDYYITEADVTDEAINLTVHGLKDERDSVNSTYWLCFESKKELKGKTVNFQEKIFSRTECNQLKYLDAQSGAFATFPNRNPLEVYYVTGFSGVREYIDLDEGLYDYDIITRYLNTFDKAYFDEKDLIIMRIKQLDARALPVFCDTNATIENGKLTITQYGKDAYGLTFDKLPEEINYLVVLIVDKNTQIDSIDYYFINEVSFDLPRRNDVFFSYDIIKYTQITTGLYQIK